MSQGGFFTSPAMWRSHLLDLIGDDAGVPTGLNYNAVPVDDTLPVPPTEPAGSVEVSNEARNPSSKGKKKKQSVKKNTATNNNDTTSEDAPPAPCPCPKP